MRLKDEHLCTLTDFHIRDGLEVEEPIYLEHLQRCSRCQEKIRRHQAKTGKQLVKPESGQAAPSVTAFSPRPADPKYWALRPQGTQKTAKEMGPRRVHRCIPVAAAHGILQQQPGNIELHQSRPGESVVTESDLEGLTDAERTILMTAAPGTRATEPCTS